MSDDGTTTKSRYWPSQGSRWWSALLIASLAACEAGGRASYDECDPFLPAHVDAGRFADQIVADT